VQRLLSLVLLFSLLVVPTAWAKNRSGAVTVEVDLSAQPQGREARLWLPYPVSDRDQLISDIRIAGDYATAEVTTDRVHGTPILYAEWPNEAKSRKLSLAFKVSREEVLRRGFPPREVAWNPADYAQYLGASSLGPIDGAVKELADKITRDKPTVLAKARAIYDWACENMYREPATVGCGKGDVCFLLQKPGGKCTDISSVFIALARASGIPAREIFGLRLGKKAEEDITGWQHCWAEFFVPGYGWVPADPADVRKAMLVEKLELDDPKTRAYREYFWGGIDPFRFRLAVGRDLVLNPPQAGAPLNTFGYPYAEIGGQPLDFYDPKNFAYRITFREIR
jgi:transglutaminase-like putative cysteine protease